MTDAPATIYRCENCEQLAREVARLVEEAARLKAGFDGVHKKYLGATRALSDLRKSRRATSPLHP